jgi:NADPH:quinone reductase-like Zn-dependent oxidoreductase
MEAYRIDRFGSVDGVVLWSSEDPRPGPKEVLMRVRASSLNCRDLMVLKGGGRNKACSPVAKPGTVQVAMHVLVLPSRLKKPRQFYRAEQRAQWPHH